MRTTLIVVLASCWIVGFFGLGSRGHISVVMIAVLLVVGVALRVLVVAHRHQVERAERWLRKSQLPQRSVVVRRLGNGQA